MILLLFCCPEPVPTANEIRDRMKWRQLDGFWMLLSMWTNIAMNNGPFEDAFLISPASRCSHCQAALRWSCNCRSRVSSANASESRCDSSRIGPKVALAAALGDFHSLNLRLKLAGTFQNISRSQIVQVKSRSGTASSGHWQREVLDNLSTWVTEKCFCVLKPLQ